MSSQSHSDRESSAARFSGLINPIRDLALNWDVDIAHTLEDYLDELELLRLPAHLLSERVSDGVTEGGEGLQGLNFAEAALLIQGSTCVYSKKVEHLHNLVFQALELISASKEGAEKKDKHGNVVAGSAQEEEAYLWGDDPSFLLLDDAAVLSASNIDLVQHHHAAASSDHQQGEALFALGSGTGKVGRRKSAGGGRLSLASDISRTSRASIVLMNSILHDDHSFGGGGAGAGASSLKMASCAMNSEGALVFAASQNAPPPSRSARSSLAPGERLSLMQATNTDGLQQHDDDEYMMLGGGGGDGYSDDDDAGNDWPVGGDTMGGDDHGDSSEQPIPLDSASVHSDDGNKGPRADPAHHTPLYNPLALLDPYELDSGSGRSGQGAGRPVNTDKKTFRLPPTSTARVNKKSSSKNNDIALLSTLNRKPAVTSLFDFHMALSSSSKTGSDLTSALALSTAAVCKPSNLLRVGSAFQQVQSRRARGQNQFYADLRQQSLPRAQASNIQHRGGAEQQYIDSELDDGGYYFGEENGGDNFDGGGDHYDDYDAQGFGGDDDDDDDGGGGFAFPRLSMGGSVVGLAEDESTAEHRGEEAQLARRVEAQLALSEALGGGSGGGSGGFGAATTDLSRSGYTNTFENLCRQHISNFMKGAEDYARETNLSRRVSAWTLRLEPLLLEQESRPVFDIHEYSDKALSLVSSKVRVKVEVTEEHENSTENERSATLEDDDDTTVNFSDVVGGESNVEVCRIFLACLQLANLGNLSFDQLSAGGTGVGSNTTGKGVNSKKAPSASTCSKTTKDISDFSVHLLDHDSNRLNIDTYRAPSALVTQQTGAS